MDDMVGRRGSKVSAVKCSGEEFSDFSHKPPLSYTSECPDREAATMSLTAGRLSQSGPEWRGKLPQAAQLWSSKESGMVVNQCRSIPASPGRHLGEPESGGGARWRQDPGPG